MTTSNQNESASNLRGVTGNTPRLSQTTTAHSHHHAFIELSFGFVFHLQNTGSRPIKEHAFKVGNAMIYYRFLIFYIS